MIIVEPSVEVFFHYPRLSDSHNSKNLYSDSDYTPQEFLERVGRTCYKSENKIEPGSAQKFIKMIKDRGHHAMLEHCVASVKFVCDRGVSHELVRHRIASFAQESTRYCNYTKDKFDNQISVVKPPFKNEMQKDGTTASDWWDMAIDAAEKAYKALIEMGESPQIARSVLPTCLKTEIWITANLREWMHFFELRCAPTAHPQMVEVMKKAREIFATEIPELFAVEKNQ